MLQLFSEAVERFGLPVRVRCDHGTENIEVARFMFQTYGVEGSHVLTGLSVHNQRIERLWVDVVAYIVSYYKNIFYNLEVNGLLSPDNEVQLYGLHYVYLPRINRSIEEFVLQWNHHGLSSERCQSPLQLMIEGFYHSRACFEHGESGASLNHDWSDFGIDDDGPVPDLQTENNVQVPTCGVLLSDTQMEILQQNVDPLVDDQNAGMNLYWQAVTIISSFIQ